MTATPTSDARRRAWETRREKYGPRGHSGYAYSRTLAQRRVIEAALDELSQARRQAQILLYQSDFKSKAAHRAVDRIDNAVQILERV